MAKQTEWEQRVADWRASGLTAEEFSVGANFAPSTLTWWARRLDNKERKQTDVRVARVLRRSSIASSRPAPTSGLVVELGASRVHIPGGADINTATLEKVFSFLGAPGRGA